MLQEVHAFCRQYGANVNQPIMFDEGNAPKTKKRCLKIAREGLSEYILHRIDYGKPAKSFTNNERLSG